MDNGKGGDGGSGEGGGEGIGGGGSEGVGGGGGEGDGGWLADGGSVLSHWPQVSAQLRWYQGWLHLYSLTSQKLVGLMSPHGGAGDGDPAGGGDAASRQEHSWQPLPSTSYPCSHHSVHSTSGHEGPPSQSTHMAPIKTVDAVAVGQRVGSTT